MTDGAWLVMSQGPEPGRTFALDRDLLTLGRDPGSDIVINDPQVSRQHARIRRQGGLVIIEDVGSTNGTFVNGVQLTGPHTLSNGDEISLGDAVRFTVHGVSVPVTEPLARQPAAPPAAPSYGPQPAYIAARPPEAQPVEEARSRTWLWVGCGCLGLLVVACIAAALFAWYAPASFWQTLIDLGIPIPTWPF